MIRANWEEYDTGKPCGYITHTDRQELAGLLGIPEVYHQGYTIPASNDYYQEYIDRAEGIPPMKIGKPYWDYWYTMLYKGGLEDGNFSNCGDYRSLDSYLFKKNDRF